MVCKWVTYSRSARLSVRPHRVFTPCISPQGNLILMKVELVLSVSGDYLDLFSNKHSARLHHSRHKPPFPASRLLQLLIGLFSPADETSITESNESKESRWRRSEERLEQGERSHLILRFNPVSRFFISRVVVRCKTSSQSSSWRSTGGHAGVTHTHSHINTALFFHLVNGHSSTNFGESTWLQSFKV